MLKILENCIGTDRDLNNFLSCKIRAPSAFRVLLTVCKLSRSQLTSCFTEKIDNCKLNFKVSTFIQQPSDDAPVEH